VALDLPLVVTTTAADSMWGPLIPELQAGPAHRQAIIDRSSVNAWYDDRFRAAVEATGPQEADHHWHLTGGVRRTAGDRLRLVPGR